MRPVSPKVRPLVDAGGFSVTDIIMNLFIFFFITFSLLATFNKEKEVTQERVHDVDLPASTRGKAAPAASVEVVLGLSDGISVDGKAVPPEGLTDAVRQALGEQKRSVVVRAHKGLSLGTTVGLLDRVWAAEPEGVSLATLLETPSADGGPAR